MLEDYVIIDKFLSTQWTGYTNTSTGHISYYTHTGIDKNGTKWAFKSTTEYNNQTRMYRIGNLYGFVKLS